jgi:uncharacterized repeat protein (TIGR02543 family)
MYEGCVISNNEMSGSVTALSSGAVNVLQGGSFIMHGGEISGNRAQHGAGGIAVRDSGSSVDIRDGVISGNSSGNSGSGIYVGNGTSLKLSAGEIIGNTAANNGGGVFCENNSAFEMTGGEISGNSAVFAGGGVYLLGNAAMELSGGEISGNTTTYLSGGGLYMASSATLDLSDTPTFDRNSAGEHGGAIYIEGFSGASTGLEVPSGARLTNNTAGQNGGGIGIAYSDLALLDVKDGATFAGNSAQVAYTRDPADDATYTAHVLGTSWTSPLTQGYNNYDIAYTNGVRIANYTLTYALDGGTNAVGNPASYSNTDTFPIAIGNPTKGGYTFEGWTVDYANASLADLTTNTKNYSIPAGTTGNITLTAQWKKNTGVIGGGESDPTPEPSATPEPSPSATPWPGASNVPKTSDEANLALWAALLGFAAILPGALSWGIKRIRG